MCLESVWRNGVVVQHRQYSATAQHDEAALMLDMLAQLVVNDIENAFEERARIA